MIEISTEKRVMQRHLHSLAGVFPLGLYLCFHLWQNWAYLDGGWPAWLERNLQVKLLFGHGIAIFFCTALALHAALGWGGTGNAGLELPGGPGLDRLQRITGLAVLLFVSLHLYQVWFWQYGDQISARGAHGALRDALGSPAQMLLYAAGISALCFHLAHGLSRAAVRWGLVRRKGRMAATRYLAGALGFTLWALALRLLGRFAVGHGLFG